MHDAAVTIESCGRTDRGRVRATNEDAYIADDALGLYAVADGVGGNAEGEVASALAIEAIAHSVRQWRAHPGALSVAGAAQAAIEAANGAVFARGGGRRNRMLTTLTLVLVDGDQAAMAHVGDSRLFRLRAGILEQLSSDHTVAAELLREGLIEAEQLEGHIYAHVLTRSIGEKATLRAEVLGFRLEPGDQLLLSSDGLNAVTTSAAGLGSLLSPDQSEATRALVDAANRAGGRDNITVVALRVLPREVSPSRFSRLRLPWPRSRRVA